MDSLACHALRFGFICLGSGLLVGGVPNDPNWFVLPENGPSTTTIYEIRVRLTSYRLNTLSDPNGLELPLLGVKVDKGLREQASAAANICTAQMNLRADTKTPVTIRLSRMP